MNNRSIALALALCLALFVPAVPTSAMPISGPLDGAPASAPRRIPIPESAPAIPPAPQGPVDAVEIAMRLLDQVFMTDDGALRMALILQASQAAPEDAEVQVSCAQLLFYLDEQDVYAAESERMLLHAMELSRGEAYLVALSAYAEQLTYWGRAEEAVPLLRQAAQDRPADAQLAVMLATTLYYDGQSDEALQSLEALLEDSPRSLEARRLYATILLDECRWDEAMTAYRQIEDGWPEYLDGLYGQYMTLIASGEFERGIRTLDLLLSSGGDDALWLDRARIRLWNLLQPERALQEAEALLRVDPDWIDAQTVKLVSLLMLQDYAGARACAREISRIDTNHADLLGAIIDMNDGRWTRAEETLTRLQGRLPESPVVSKNLAAVRLDGFDDADGALGHMADAFEKAGDQADTELYVQLGHVYLRQGEWLQAARAYAEGDRLIFDDASALYYLAMACLDAGRMQDAEEALAEMERRYPGWYETMLTRVLLEDAAGRPEDALASYARLAEKYPFPAEAAPLLEGMLLAGAGDTDGAQRLKAIAEGDGSAEDWDAYAYALLLLGDPDGAEAALANAAALVPEATRDNAGRLHSLALSLLITRADLLLAQGDAEGALEAFAEAAERGWNPNRLGSGDAYEALRQLDGYAALMATAPLPQDDWDVSIGPVIPK